jgi:hypothetical protein
VTEVQVEARRAGVLDDELVLPQPGAAREQIPPERVEGPSIRLDADGECRSGRLGLPELSTRAFGDQFHHPRERALDRQTLTRCI